MRLKPQALPISVLLYWVPITRSCSSLHASTSTSAFEQFWNIVLCPQLQKASGPDGPWLFSSLPSCLTPYLLASFYGFYTRALSFQCWGLVHSSLHPRTWYSSWSRVGSSPTIHRMHWPLAELFRPQQHCMLVCKSVTDVVLGKGATENSNTSITEADCWAMGLGLFHFVHRIFHSLANTPWQRNMAF